MSRLTTWLRSRRVPPKARIQPPTENIGRHRLAPQLVCEVDAETAARQAMFDHIAECWSQLGETEPHWSVLTNPKYFAAAFSEHKNEFFDPAQSGAPVVATIFARNGESFAGLTTCLELGCGVGRSTATLAQLFPQMVAVDVSPAHLALARAHLAGLGLDNVSWQQVRAIEDFTALPRFDLLFSEYVLQHNPPPIVAAMLERLFAKLNPGGYCLFQMPTYVDNYRFSVKEYLASRRAPDPRRPDHSMEIHILPQRVIYRLMREADIELIDVVEDGLIGHPSCQSLTFFARKARPGA
jgi:SAM-dependent methyltransferase